MGASTPLRKTLPPNWFVLVDEKKAIPDSLDSFLY
jgi:hypothetical protein